MRRIKVKVTGEYRHKESKDKIFVKPFNITMTIDATPGNSLNYEVGRDFKLLRYVRQHVSEYCASIRTFRATMLGTEAIVCEVLKFGDVPNMKRAELEGYIEQEELPLKAKDYKTLTLLRTAIVNHIQGDDPVPSEDPAPPSDDAALSDSPSEDEISGQNPVTVPEEDEEDTEEKAPPVPVKKAGKKKAGRVEQVPVDAEEGIPLVPGAEPPPDRNRVKDEDFEVPPLEEAEGLAANLDDRGMPLPE